MNTNSTREFSGPPPTFLFKLVTAFITTSGFASVLLAMWLFKDIPSVRVGIYIAIIGFIMTVNAVTVSFHRYLTHRSFDMLPWLAFVYAALASMAVEGSALTWPATHRMHHHHSDKEGDPHSPHLHGQGFVAMIKGFLHAHMGWIFYAPSANNEMYIPDLLENNNIMLVAKLTPLWAVLSFVIPGVVEWFFIPTLEGFLMGVLWGGFVRVFAVHHLTWSINSICHMWGTKPFRSQDQSVNNPIFGVVGFGEGWHRNHHAFKWSARIGIRFWEIDFGWYTIWMLEKLGMVWNVKVPSAEQLARARIQLVE